MKVLPGEKDHEYVLEFSDQQEFENFFDNADREGAFSLEQPGLSARSEFRAVAIGSPRSRKIRPLKVVPDGNFARIVLTEVVSDSHPAQPEEKREPVKSIQEQLRGMTVSEKAMLAMKANLADRRLLMQDQNPKIQEFLMRNPRITEPEIAWIARNPMSAIPTLLTIIQHKEWMATDAIRQGILTNPKTPAHIIMDRLPYLSPADLLKMHHAKNLRDDIREAVQKQMKKKGIIARKDL